MLKEKDIMHTISSLAESAHQIERGRKLTGDKTNYVVALSVGTGTGGREIGNMLAKHLGVELYNRRIVEFIAREAHLDKNAVERLDERMDGFKGAWLYSILAGANISKENYYQNLTNVIRGVALRGGVIIGRGGCFILKELPVLRVHIVGTLEACAKRLAAEEGIDLATAKQKVTETDQQRRSYIKKIFHCTNSDDPIHFDLVINTDRLALKDATDLIIRAREATWKFEEGD